MLASIPSATLLGATGSPVRVEVHVGAGLPGYRIVGLPDTACRESRDRVRAAVLSSRRQWPKQCDHRQPRPVRHAQVRRRARPGHRRRRARRQRAAADRPPWRATASSASWVSTARCGGSPASPRWWPCSATSSPSSRARSSAEAHVGVAVRCTGRLDARRGRRRADRRGAVARRPRPASVASTSHRRPTWPTCGASPSPAGRWRSPPPAATTCCSSGRRGRARRCSPSACRACCRRSTEPRRSAATMVHSAAGLPLPPRRPRHRAAVPGAAPHHLDRRPRRRRLGDAAAGRDLASPRRRAVPRRARRVRAGGARRAARAARGGRHPGRPGPQPRRPAGPVPARRGHQPVPVRRRAAGVVRVRRHRPRCATSAGCRGRCSTASTCGSRCSARPSTSCSIPAAASRAPSSPRRVAGGPARRARAVPAASTPASHGAALDEYAPLTADRPGPAAGEIERDRLTGRGYHRVRRVARTIADLDGAATGRPRRAAEPSTSSTSRCALSLRTRVARRDAGTGGADGRRDVGHLAALAGFDLMTVARLRVPARPPRAGRGARRRRRPSPAGTRRRLA